MDMLLSFAGFADRLGPGIGALLERFRDESVPLHLSIGIAAAAMAILAALVVWGTITGLRIRALRRLVRSCGTGEKFGRNFDRLNKALAGSIFGAAWIEYRHSLKTTNQAVLYLRRPDEYLGLHAISSRSFPARFFAAAHGYFIGVGLLLTFVGLVAALKFAALGVASPDLTVAKDALNALLAAASFKFMTSIAGLGCSLILSMAVRSMTYSIESAAQGLAGDLERAMTPVLTESLAYDQLAATQAQLFHLEKLNALQAAPAREANEDATHREALQKILTSFLAEMRGTAGNEMKQLAGKLSGVGEAIDQMQNHIGHSGEHFAEQMSLAASRLLTAATTLQESIDGRFERVAARIDALGATFARGEALFSATAEKAASNLRNNFEQVDASIAAQVGNMRDIVSSLDRVREVLDSSATNWMTSAAPVAASVEASRAIAVELGLVAKSVDSTQHDMTEMAKSVVQLSERVGSRFEKIDDDMQAVFERLQGGTRDFGAEVMDFVGKLDTSLANGMQAFSLGTEELREVAQMLVVGSEAKAA